MTEYFDELDTMDSQQREEQLFSSLPSALTMCIDTIPLLKKHLNGVNPADITHREALQHAPVMRKTDLMSYQNEQPPFGGFVNTKNLQGSRVFMSPGPVWEPQVGGVDPWQAARCLHAAGIRAGDFVHNAFSYHLTPGGFILDEGARALGCVVFPAGVGNTDMQVQALAHIGASAYIGTPDYLQTLLDAANEQSIALPALKRAMVSGGALFPAMRESYQQAGIAVQQAYATADLGVIAYETSSEGEVHPGLLLNEQLIVEIVRPGSGVPVAPGEVGEIVVTRMHPDYPLFRFATGDLSKELLEPSPCGRTQRRIAGWMGRADQRTKVRGMFVDPVQIETLRQQHPDIEQARLLVARQEQQDTMTLMVRLSGTGEQSGSAERIAESLTAITKMKANVEIVTTPLADDGIVIEDQREYDS